MVNRCNCCGKFIDWEKVYVCEICGGNHHPECSGECYEGDGEYPDENSYSICKKCTK